MGQLRLKNTAVLIIGAGGLGCPCGMYLAAAAAGMTGCIQALEAIKFVTSRERLLTDKMFIFDMLTMKTRTAKFGGISSRCSIFQNNQ